VLSDRSSIFELQGRLGEARAELEEGLAIAIALKDDWNVSLCQIVLAEREFATGDPHRAVALGTLAVESARRVRQEVYALGNLATYQFAAGDVDAADANAREAVRTARTSDLVVVHWAMQLLAAIAAVRGRPAEAARLLGHVDAWLERIGLPRDHNDMKTYSVLLRALGEQLGEEDIAALTAQGARLSDEAAIDEALALP